MRASSRSRTRCRRRSRSCARRCSARCSTPPPQRGARPSPTSRCSSRAAVYRAGDAEPRRRAPRARRAAGRPPDAERRGGPAPAPPTSSPPRACSRRCSTRCASTGASHAETWPFLHPGRCAEVRRGRRRLGFLGELHPLVAAHWDLERPSPRSRSTSAGRRRRARGRPATRPSSASRRCARTSRSSSPGTSPRAAWPRSSAGRAATLLAGAEVFDVYRGAQVGEGRVSLAFAPRVPGRRPHADRRGGRARARRDRRGAAPTSWEVSCVAERSLVVGASGYAGAIAAALLDRHPDFELAAITAATDAGGRLSDLYPHHRVPLVLEELDLDRDARRRRRDRRLPARGGGAGRRGAARARRARGRPLRRLPPARRRDLRAAGTASTRRPS